MTILEAIILGIVQGLTEFLPVSSSGHLVIAERILGVKNTSLAFELTVHLGTLAAVIFMYRKSLYPMILRPFSKKTLVLIMATIPTVAIFFLFDSIFRSAFDGRYLVYCFLATAILLLISGRFRPQKRQLSDKIGVADGLIIGIVQGVAAFPGISRSGSTISAGIMLGKERKSAAEFSFILSIPIIIGSAFFELISTDAGASINFLPLLTGFFAAFISGLLAIKLLLRVLNSDNFDGFAVYLLCLSIFLTANDYFLFLF